MNQLTNPERDQDRVEDLLDNWRKYGYLMFPQQRAIYEELAEVFSVAGLEIMDAGCGTGLGTALISECTQEPWPYVLGTDKGEDNVKFAKCLYPWVAFEVWDFTTPWDGQPFDVVVCVEAIEHVEDIHSALKNLIGAAKKEVWISTPNGKGKEKPPSNPFHVRELTTREFLIEVGKATPRTDRVDIYSWEDLSEPEGLDTDADPLVYRIKLRS